MSRCWLKLIGTSKKPWDVNRPYPWPYVRSRKRMRKMRPGDMMVLYAVGGSKRVFGLVRVTSAVRPSNDKDWPWEVGVAPEISMAPNAGVDIEQVSTPEWDIMQSIPRAAYFELTPSQYQRAESKLREAAARGGSV